MNPPYGSVGGDTLHLKFVDKILDIADKQVSIFPYSFVTKLHNKAQNKYKEKFSKYLKSIEEINAKDAFNIKVDSCGIYTFDSKESNNIEIKPLNGEIYNINSLLSLSNFSNYEKEIIKYLEKEPQKIIWGGGMDKRKKELENISIDKQKEFLDNKIINNCKELKRYFDSNKYLHCLIINQSNGNCNGKAFSSKNGQIFNTYNSCLDFFLDRRISNGYNIMLFNSKKAAENCKIALDNPLLRFTIYRMQDDQQMFKRVYKYVPDIDWEDDRVKTDEGLLEVCGCPKDKCKEYAEYCKKIIEQVDKK